MELNWTTLVLEILNFLVLVWLLKRFFYQPVKDVIVRRQQEIEEQIAQAAAQQRQAEDLRVQYEGRIAEWEQERKNALIQLSHEIESERQRLKVVLAQEIEGERQKAAVLAERALQKQRHQMEAQALEQGARFVARLLKAIASPDVQKSLFDYLIKELAQLPPARCETLRSVVTDGQPVDVVSAYPLNEEQRRQLERQLSALVSRPLNLEFHANGKLLAGLHLSIGPWVLHANLHEELKTFAAIAYER